MARHAEPYRREAILQAATKAFSDNGFSETRLSDIADRAGIVTSTLYLYFESKDEMLRAIAQDMREQLSARLTPVIPTLSNEAGIDDIVQIVMDFAVENVDRLKLWNLSNGLRRVRMYNVRFTRGAIFQQAFEVFPQLMEEGKIRQYDPEFLADLLVGFLRWMLENATLIQEEERARFQQTCVQWLCNALLPTC